MGFLSRKKPKPAPVEIQEEQPIGDELQQMEELVPERTDEYAFEVEPGSYEGQSAEPAGPVSDSGLSRSGESSESSPPAAEASEPDEQPTTMFEAVTPEVEEEEAPEEAALNAEEPDVSDDDEPGDGRMKAIDLLAPTRLDFLKEREAATEEPVKTAEVIAFANQKGGVAKTTTTLNLAVAFAETGHRVLCIDLDPQEPDDEPGDRPRQGRKKPLRRPRQRHADLRDHR
jgi:AAA domain